MILNWIWTWPRAAITSWARPSSPSSDLLNNYKKRRYQALTRSTSARSAASSSTASAAMSSARPRSTATSSTPAQTLVGGCGAGPVVSGTRRRRLVNFRKVMRSVAPIARPTNSRQADVTTWRAKRRGAGCTGATFVKVKKRVTKQVMLYMHI